MAIAEGILDIAFEYARRNEAKRVAKIGLLIGEMSGVETEALEFAFDALSKGTLAEGARLSITKVPLVGRCSSCKEERRIERYDFVCPSCGGVTEIVSGREMKVGYLEME